MTQTIVIILLSLLLLASWVFIPFFFITQMEKTIIYYRKQVSILQEELKDRDSFLKRSATCRYVD